VKLLLKETGSSADTLLSLLISTASADFKQATKRDILFASYSEVRDGNGTKAMEPRQYPVVAVTLVKVDETEIPAQPAYTSGQTPPYGWVVVDDRIEIESGWACGLPLPADSFVGETQPARFRRGNGNVTLEYTAGYVTVPADIDLAVAMWVAYRYKETDHIGQRSKSLDGGGTVAYLTDDALRLGPGRDRPAQQDADLSEGLSFEGTVVGGRRAAAALPRHRELRPRTAAARADHRRPGNRSRGRGGLAPHRSGELAGTIRAKLIENDVRFIETVGPPESTAPSSAA
jgi:hypothetical protein